MNELLDDLFKDCKERAGFPPRDQANEIKERMNYNGVLHSSMTVREITKLYIGCLRRTLECFLAVLLMNVKKLPITGENDLEIIINEKLNFEFARLPGSLNEVLAGVQQDGRNIYGTLISEAQGNLRDSLNRKRRLAVKGLDFGGFQAALSIIGSQVGNLIIGSVSDSEVISNLQVLSQRGTAEKGLAEALSQLTDAIKTDGILIEQEKRELYELIKGVSEQARLAQDKRNPSVLKAVLGSLSAGIFRTTEAIAVFEKVYPIILSFFV